MSVVENDKKPKPKILAFYIFSKLLQLLLSDYLVLS